VSLYAATWMYYELPSEYSGLDPSFIKTGLFVQHTLQIIGNLRLLVDLIYVRPNKDSTTIPDHTRSSCMYFMHRVYMYHLMI
jgi:hypothetical protein